MVIICYIYCLETAVGIVSATLLNLILFQRDLYPRYFQFHFLKVIIHLIVCNHKLVVVFLTDFPILFSLWFTLSPMALITDLVCCLIAIMSLWRDPHKETSISLSMVSIPTFPVVGKSSIYFTCILESVLRILALNCEKSVAVFALCLAGLLVANIGLKNV